nr:MAG TPA: hypothetical protein [Caudoviricetes sp.]
MTFQKSVFFLKNYLFFTSEICRKRKVKNLSNF